jgi:hypothetical protein
MTTLQRGISVAIFIFRAFKMSFAFLFGSVVIGLHRVYVDVMVFELNDATPHKNAMPNFTITK